MIGIPSAEIVADHESWPSLVAIPEETCKFDGGVRLHVVSVRDRDSRLTPSDPFAGGARKRDPDVHPAEDRRIE